MCGRFVSRTDAEMERAFGLTRSRWRRDWTSYNVAPSQAVPIIRAAQGEREGVLVRWGLIPFWAKGEVPGYSTIITLPANPLVAEIHAKGRMPAMRTPEECAHWLEGDEHTAREVLTPFPAARMEAWPVSRKVNSPANDGPELVQPLDDGGGQ